LAPFVLSPVFVLETRGVAVKWNVVIRKLHSWTSVLIALPALVMIASGLLLQVKKQWTWVQPEERRGTGSVPQVSLQAILESVAAAPEVSVISWQDVKRVDIRPSRGLAKVSLADGLEIQVDLGTGRVLHTAHRRSDVIEALHDGSFFAGDWTKLGVFLPTGMVLLFLWGSGLWLFVLPRIVRRRQAVARLDQALPTRRAPTGSRPLGA
jgi:uncharacterized iron-regulated membrane protein